MSSEAAMRSGFEVVLAGLVCSGVLAADVPVMGPPPGEIVFVERHSIPEHYYANFGYACTDEKTWLHGRDGGRLAVLDPVSGVVRTLLADPGGAMRDPDVHYDGRKILFSYRKGGTHHFNLYEINTDGTGLRQITVGDWDDVEPAYLPDGGIIFCSTRSKRYVLCWLAPVANLFRCNAAGGELRQLSSGSVTENTPVILPDGRILYTRWEYVNRDAVSFHHLWTMKPDGTGAMTYFGNMYPGGVYIDARPVPGTDRVVFVDSGYHGRQEHQGTLMMLDLKKGPDDRSSVSPVAAGENVRDPFPVSGSCILAARGNEVVQLDGRGGVKVLYRSDVMVHEPRLLVARKREKAIPSRLDFSKVTGTLFLNDVAMGRNMAGVKPGAIRKLLVMEDLCKPANYHGGGTTPIAHGGAWTLKRILGTVPVEADGSAFFEVPACRSIYFAALDENNLCVKQMRSFVTLQQGEQVGCIGCHEKRTVTDSKGVRLAGRRPPSVIEPLAGFPEIFDFPRDVQPILDRHCVSCHNAEKRAGGVELTGDHGPTYSLAYYNLMLHQQVKDGAGLKWPGVKNVGGRPAGNDVPYATYSSAAPLMKKIEPSHHDVKLSDHERAVIRLWVDSGAVYAGTYAAYGTGQIGGWWGANQPIREMDDKWPSTAAAREVVKRRCSVCHEDRLPVSVTAQIKISYGDMEGWERPTTRFSRHRIFNLSRPERSLALTVPLAKAAGGFAEGAIEEKKPVPDDLGRVPLPVTHRVIFADRADSDYRAILAHLQAAEKRLAEIRRFDMAGFRPRYEYLREMKRYGVLPADFDLAAGPVDSYELDRRYWQQFWPKAQ